MVKFASAHQCGQHAPFLRWSAAAYAALEKTALVVQHAFRKDFAPRPMNCVGHATTMTADYWAGPMVPARVTGAGLAREQP